VEISALLNIGLNVREGKSMTVVVVVVFFDLTNELNLIKSTVSSSHSFPLDLPVSRIEAC